MVNLFSGKSSENNASATAFAAATEKLKAQLELLGKSVSLCVITAEQKAELTQQPAQPSVTATSKP